VLLDQELLLAVHPVVFLGEDLAKALVNPEPVQLEQAVLQVAHPVLAHSARVLRAPPRPRAPRALVIPPRALLALAFLALAPLVLAVPDLVKLAQASLAA
jgi:hypothetical protein